jgi:uncharacterized lipoprotein YddW (UPF0748 family)
MRLTFTWIHRLRQSQPFIPSSTHPPQRAIAPSSLLSSPDWRSHLIRPILLGIILGVAPLPLLAVLPTYAETLLPTDTKQRQTAPVSLGVVRSSENQSDWATITQRLQTVGIQYKVVEVEGLDQPDQLADLNVLFLPNVQTLSSAQVIALGAWMNQGGRLVVSGPVGQNSAYGVQRALRSLLGGYWSSDLPRPTSLEVHAAPSYSAEGLTAQIQGGVLQPSGLTSQTLAIWSGATSNTAAVLATQRTVLLGWEWGTAVATSDFDALWLRTAISRFGDLETAPTLAAPMAPPPATSTAPTPPPTASLPPARSTPSVPQTSVSPLQPSPARPPSPVVTDPAEQVAPAGVPVEISPLPISTLEAIAMREELENLIGRFESALLAANAATNDISVLNNSTTTAQKEAAHEDEPEALLVATADPDQTLIRGTAPAAAHHAAAQAREILTEFSDLVRAGEYETARRQWLAARQLLWDNLPTDRPLAQPEIRAMWLDRGTIVRAGSPQRLAAIFDQMAMSGINTVFIETVNAGYPIYPSTVAPEQNPLTRHWDPLAAAVDLAHERDMEIHAWVWTFAVGNTRHNELLGQPTSYLGPVLEANPTWAGYDDRGRVTPPGQTKPFLDPANPEARRYLLRLFEEIVTRYDVDGLHLDYIRYPFQDPSANRSYGYGTAAREQFQRLTGTDPATISPNDRDLWAEWTAFRTEQINSFVAEVSQMLHRQDPALILSAAVFAMGEHERLQKIQQNWERWAREGQVDMIVTMSYAMDTNRLQRLAGPWVNANDLGATLVVPGIRLLHLSESATFDQIQALRDMPSSGYALFAVENLDESLQDIFSRTQGQPEVAIAPDPIPYRDPFGTAAARYNALLREWSFLLDTESLYMSGPRYEEWQAQAEALSVALERLAQNPSASNLQRAQRQLDQFRAGFGDWMQLQRWSDGYRVSTWENRLQLLDTLLRYGDRKLSLES